MFYIILILFMLPFAEIYVLLTAGSAYGALPVIAATIFTAVLGGVIIRWQGLTALNRLREDMSGGHTPIAPVVDGVFLLIAAPFLMTPGFITDAFGFLLLVPLVRDFIAKIFLRKVKTKIDKGEAQFTSRRF